MQTIKKYFPLHKIDEERQFLEEQSRNGYKLHQLSKDSYEFLAYDDSTYTYAVEYYIQEITDIQKAAFESNGYELLYTYPSNKGGTYYYWVRPVDIDLPEVTYTQDLADAITLNLNHISRFSAIVLLVFISFYLYLYLTKGLIIYLCLVGVGCALGIYLGIHWFKMKNKIKILLQKG